MNDTTIAQARLQNKMKNPIVALALGFIIPGAAQMYAGKVMWGVINCILAIIFAITVVGAPIAFIIWAVSMVLGYKGTIAYNEIVIDKAEAKI